MMHEAPRELSAHRGIDITSESSETQSVQGSERRGGAVTRAGRSRWWNHLGPGGTGGGEQPAVRRGSGVLMRGEGAIRMSRLRQGSGHWSAQAVPRPPDVCSGGSRTGTVARTCRLMYDCVNVNVNNLLAISKLCACLGLGLGLGLGLA